MPQSITACYVGTLGHFTYTSNLTGLKLNSLFSYICSFSFVPYLIQGVIFPAVIRYGNMSPFRFFLISSQYQIFIKSHRVYSQRHSLLSHPITTILFQAFASSKLAYLGFFTGFLCLWLSLFPDCLPLHPPNC